MNKISGTIVLSNGKTFTFKARSPRVALAEAVKTLNTKSSAPRKLQKAGVTAITWNEKLIYPLKHHLRSTERKTRQANRILKPNFPRNKNTDAGVRIHRQHVPMAA